jgi:hypothetical protein
MVWIYSTKQLLGPGLVATISVLGGSTVPGPDFYRACSNCASNPHKMTVIAKNEATSRSSVHEMSSCETRSLADSPHVVSICRTIRMNASERAQLTRRGGGQKIRANYPTTPFLFYIPLNPTKPPMAKEPKDKKQKSIE